MPYTNHRDHNLKMKSVGGGENKRDNDYMR